MLKLAQFSLLAVGVAVTTASAPIVSPAQPLIALAPLAIIEGGTVSTLPKSAKGRSGKVVVVRGRAERAAVQPTKKPSPGRSTRDAARTCACAAPAATGGSAGDVVELRNTETGLRVMILGPDGLARTRYVPAPPGMTARHSQDD